MQALGIFFKYFPKLQRKLEASIPDVTDKENLKSKIKPLCETWCVERHTVFEDLFILCDPVLHRLELIQITLIQKIGLIQSSLFLSIIATTDLVILQVYQNSCKDQQLKLQQLMKWFLW